MGFLFTLRVIKMILMILDISHSPLTRMTRAQTRTAARSCLRLSRLAWVAARAPTPGLEAHFIPEKID